ncbi:PKD domain-containing protein [Terrimonas sp.]|uniref:PKD domain-containing protein n=1 Tax=Terrimonas sp. TaxID=1914338 RepID=UPI0014041C07|nr:T9SS type A sorting domain-containing protein [Terrimonas sp.]
MNQNNSNPYAHVFYTLLLFLFSFCLSSRQTYAQTMQTTQRAVYSSIYTNVGGFFESLPNDYSSNPSKKYPLIVALHGVGELGNGSQGVLELVAKNGITKLLNDKKFPATFSYGGQSFSFIVLSPQMKVDNDWQNSIQATIDYAKKTYRVDEQRIYLTGLSMGGVAAFSYAASTVERGKGLAAAVLVTPGWAGNSFQLNNISASQLPIWVTNNSGDPYNSPSTAQELVNNLNSLVPPPPKAILTIFDKSGHDAWTATYDPGFRQGGLSVYEWMLSYKRGTTTPVLTANAGSDKVITLPTNTVTLDAGASSVSSGSITSYSWAKVSGPSGETVTLLSNGLQAKLTGLVAGVYEYKLTIKDSNGSTATDNVIVTVNSSGTSTDPPVANAGKEQTITLPVSSCTLDGSYSKASTGNTIVSYKWTKYSGPSGGDITSPSSVKTTITGLIAGTYIYSLTVTDSRGQSKTGGTVVTVNGTQSTDPPVANAGKEQTIILPVSSCTLDGSYSKASTGNTIVSYKWTKYSGPSGGNITSPSSVKTTITGLIAGTYIYSLTVTDSRGQSKTGGTVVTVNGTQSTDPPVANAGKEQTITLPVSSCTLDGSYSKASTGNTIVSYKWTKYSGPSGGNITSPSSVKTTITGLIAGTYIYSLTVTDSRGQSKTGGTIVYVNASGSARVVSGIAGNTDSLSASLNKFEGIKETADKNFDVIIAPNPVTTNMNLQIKGNVKGKTNILIYNLGGALHKQQEFTKDNGVITKQIDMSGLPSGIYLVKVMVDGRYKKIVRIVKR